MKRDPSKTFETSLGKSPVTIGRYSYGFDKKKVIQTGEGAALRIGSFCAIADGGYIFLGSYHHAEWATTYPFGHIYRDQLGNTDIKGHPTTRGDVIIGNDVWMGALCTVMSGVTIGDGAVIAANAHVVKDVPPYAIVGGNPGKFIRYRFAEEIIDLLMQLRWWELSEDAIREIAPQLSQEPSVALLSELLRKYR